MGDISGMSSGKIQPAPPENFEAAFARQLREFRELFYQAMKEGPLGPKLASPKTVLSFAEDLMLCPTEDAAKALLQRDREGARGVYAIAGDAVRSGDAKRAQALIRTGPNQTPFFVLAAVVRLIANATIERYGGNHWPSPIIVSRD
jgi:hypothetical protein